MSEALKARLKNASKRDITQEEGLLIQQTLHAVDPSFALVALPYAPVAVDEQLTALKTEVEKRADAIRAQNPDYMYDDEIFTPVPLISRTKPPDAVEAVKVRKGIHRGAGVRKSTCTPAGASSTAAPQAPGAAGQAPVSSASGSASAQPATAAAPGTAAPAVAAGTGIAVAAGTGIGSGGGSVAPLRHLMRRLWRPHLSRSPAPNGCRS